MEAITITFDLITIAFVAYCWYNTRDTKSALASQIAETRDDITNGIVAIVENFAKEQTKEYTQDAKSVKNMMKMQGEQIKLNFMNMLAEWAGNKLMRLEGIGISQALPLDNTPSVENAPPSYSETSSGAIDEQAN